jgi:hypothetical protein
MKEATRRRKKAIVGLRQWIVEQLYRIYEDGEQGFDAMMKKLGRMMAETIMYIDREELAVPSTPYDVKGLLKSAIRDDNPVVFLEQAANFAIKGQVPEEEYLVPFRFVQALEGRNSLTCAGREVTGTKTGTEVINAL